MAWAQYSPPEDPPPAEEPPPDEAIGLGPGEEEQLDPDPEEVITDPVPPDDYDLNHQGIIDKKRDLAVYTGCDPHYKPWTHHAHYRQVCLEWYAVLRERWPALRQLVDGGSVKVIEIDYWYDPTPAPDDYLAWAEVYTSDGAFLADVYLLSGDQRDARLAFLAGILGRDVFLSVAHLR